ncbi:ribosome maturation factor RimM [Anaerovorax odorimutans]|uniref:ribosome maturation factor RimM n=1 Tax=Anaerovorax odorimutans TaxID=109327 RepID=UPI0004266C12|nr:ribosome maturation factor RimM [Anaerovorax odorimutans]
MEKIKIGQIVNVVGLKGELKVYHYSDYKERFEEIEELYIEDISYNISKVRYIKEMVILKLKGIDDRTEAEKYKGKNLYIPEKELRILPKDTYYIKDLKGLLVYDEDNNYIGVLCDVIQNRAQDLYEIEMENKNKFLIPAVDNFILKIDMTNRTMIVRLIKGLMEL